MNKDNSLVKIDVTKLLLWICVFLIAIFVLTAILVIPNINKLKIANTNLNSSNMLLNSNSEKKSNLENKLNDFLKQNKEDLDKLSNEFDVEKFKDFCKIFFESVEIEKTTSMDEDFASYQLFVSTKITSPTVFYNFIDSLEKYSNIIKVYFPIIMKSNENMIKAQFSLQVFNR